MKKHPSKKHPSGITYQAVYESDLERMIKAIRIMLDYKPNKTEKSEVEGNK